LVGLEGGKKNLRSTIQRKKIDDPVIKKMGPKTYGKLSENRFQEGGGQGTRMPTTASTRWYSKGEEKGGKLDR